MYPPGAYRMYDIMAKSLFSCGKDSATWFAAGDIVWLRFLPIQFPLYHVIQRPPRLLIEGRVDGTVYARSAHQSRFCRIYDCIELVVFTSSYFDDVPCLIAEQSIYLLLFWYICHSYNPPFCERQRRGYETQALSLVIKICYTVHGSARYTTETVEVSGGAV